MKNLVEIIIFQKYRNWGLKSFRSKKIFGSKFEILSAHNL